MSGERRGTVVLGVLLVALGSTFFVLNATGAEFEAWPLLVIVPGLVLFALAFATGGEPGTGFAIAGGIVTTVGLILAVQEATGLYATWAYAWALVAPTSVGLSLAVYGALTNQPKLVAGGLPTLAVGLALFLGFGIFFEGFIGLSGERLSGVRGLLPAAMILLGVLLVGGSLFGRRGR